MSYGPRSESRSLGLVDVSAPGAPIWVIDPTQDPVTGKVRFSLRLPTTDANGGALTGLNTLAIAYNLNSGFNLDDSMETILADTQNSRVVIDVSGNTPGDEINGEVDPLGTAGTQYFTAACAD